MQSTIEIVSNLVGSATGLDAIKDQMSALLNNGSNLVFFQQINSYLNREIAEFGVSLLGRTMKWVGSVALVLMTIWIMIQGFRIITGQSRDSMMALVTNSLRATLIVGIATGWGVMGGNLFNWMGDGLQKNITVVVTGNDVDVYELIDENLGYMQLAFSSIDALQDGASPIAGDQKTRAMWFTGIGTGGPAITAGVMLLLNKIAIALFTGLGPIFILCLLFDQTKQLFSRWLFYGIGTMFSLAVLSVMVALSLDVVKAVSIAFWVNTFLGGSNEGVNSMALQQGGLGLVLTMLIISAPPMAAAFFQGVLGSFNAQNAFYNTGALGGNRSQSGVQPGYPGYRPETAPQNSSRESSNERSMAPPSSNQAVASNDVRSASDAKMGNANALSNLPVRPAGGIA